VQIISSIVIQIICAQPMAKARKGASLSRARPMAMTANEPTPNRPARMSPGIVKSLNGLPSSMATVHCMALPSGEAMRNAPPPSAQAPRIPRKTRVSLPHRPSRGFGTT
jgi:hypothetical protein